MVAKVLVKPEQTPRNIGINQEGDQLFMVAGCCHSLFFLKMESRTDYRCVCARTQVDRMMYPGRMTAQEGNSNQAAVELWVEDWCGHGDGYVTVKIEV